MAEYIEREAALAFQNELEPMVCKSIMTDELFSATKDSDLVAFLQNIPSADVVTRDCYDRLLVENDELRKARPVARGKWVRHYTRPNVYEDLYWHCTVCGYKNNDNYANVYHKFCPNCGARMEGDTDA